jgi:outer membrane protein
MNLITRTAMAAMLISILAASPASAEEALTLQKARELVLARSSILRKTELAVDAALLESKSQRYAYLPSASASVSGAKDYGDGAGSLKDSVASSANLSASETVFDGGKTRALVEKANLATEGARESLRQTRLTLIGDADSAFYSILSAAATVDAATSDLEAARTSLEIAKAKAQTGNLSKADLLQNEAEMASKETTLILARKTLASAKAKLASLTGLPTTAALQPVDFALYDELMRKLSALDEEAMGKLVSGFSALAKKNSPTLSGYALASGEAKAAVNAAKAAYLPTVAAGFSHGLSYAADSNTSSGSLSLTASLSLDLWNTKNAVDSARVAAAEAELDGSEGTRSLELDVEQATYEWLGSAQSVISSAKALEYAESNYANILEKYKLSSASVSDLSTAAALLASDKTALISARYAFLTDLSTIRGYAGLESESELLTAIP